MSRNIFILLFSFLLFSSSCTESKKETSAGEGATKPLAEFPKPVGYVNDFEEVFSAEEEAELSSIIKQHEQQTSNELVIVTVSDIAPYTDMKSYAIDLGNEWEVGQKDKNNGIAIVLSRKLKEVYITTGSGMGITDDQLQAIIDSVMIPRYIEGKEFEGTKSGLEAIIGKVASGK